MFVTWKLKGSNPDVKILSYEKQVPTDANKYIIHTNAFAESQC